LFQGRATTSYACTLREQGDSCLVFFHFQVFRGVELGEGVIFNYDPAHVFFGYDTSVIRINTSSIIAKGIGKTSIYVRHPNQDSTRIVDTLQVKVENTHGRLQVKINSPA
jgi:hypothetical protein